MLSRKAILIFLASFTLLYGCIVAVCVYFSLFAYTETLLLKAASTILPWVEWSQIDRILELTPWGIRILTSTPWTATYVLEGSYYHHSHNLFVMVALVLASPGLGWRRRLVGLVVGCAVIFVLDLVILMGDIWNYDRSTGVGGRHTAIVSGSLSLFASLLGQLHPTGGGFLLPMFLWVFVLLGSGPAFRDSHPPRPPRAQGRRSQRGGRSSKGGHARLAEELRT